MASSSFHYTRRNLIRTAGVAAVAMMTEHNLLGQQAKKEEIPVAPTEDLMREHGILNRLLLVYEEIGRRLDSKEGADPKLALEAAGIVRKFIEDYHEKLEEQYLFPRFEKAGRLTDLVGALRQQHDAGRKVTDEILRLARTTLGKKSSDRDGLIRAFRSYVRMYRPHEAREDTVLFPAVRDIVSRKEFDELGEIFEEKEHELFGEQGFGEIVEQVAGVERRLGIYELAQFTPK